MDPPERGRRYDPCEIDSPAPLQIRASAQVATVDFNTRAGFTNVSDQNGLNLPLDFSNDQITISAISTIPEPSTWAMMLVGFGLLGGAGYWTRRRSVAPKLSSEHPRKLSPPEGLARRPGSPRAAI
jgi:hypothetical protein